MPGWKIAWQLAVEDMLVVTIMLVLQVQVVLEELCTPVKLHLKLSAHITHKDTPPIWFLQGTYIIKEVTISDEPAYEHKV